MIEKKNSKEKKIHLYKPIKVLLSIEQFYENSFESSVNKLLV